VRLRRQLLIGGLVTIGIGAIASGLLTWAWFTENLSGDFADQETGAIHLGFTAAIFLTWTAALAVPPAVLISLGILLRWLARRDRGR
jgi:hypothetical protein